MDVIITAGGVPQPDEPLYAETRGGPKALLEIAGKPMIQYVLDAFGGSARIERIIIAGLPLYNDFNCAKPIQMMEDRGNMLDNIRGALDILVKNYSAPRKVIVCSSDIPALTTEMVDWLIDRIEETDRDFYYNVITRATMETRFPGSKRTYLRMKDLEVCGGDMNALDSCIATENPIWDKLVETRKSPLKQAALLGYDTLLGILLHRISLGEAEVSISKRLGVKAKALICPFAEMGMDVDKPNQLEMLRADLAQRRA